MTHTEEEIRKAVHEEYANIAKDPSKSVGCNSDCCRGAKDFDVVSMNLGYSKDEVRQVPEGSNLGLGCGNPQAIAGLKTGETVLDLGSGAGFDCFLAANQVGGAGKVIGVDMTHEMLQKAKANAVKGKYTNTEFRLGEIENLPVADNTVDCVISNCVVNLSPNKRRVFQEAYRVLKVGGRLAISDVVATADLPDEIKHDMTLLAGCVAGAESINVLTTMLVEIGFKNVEIVPKEESKAFIKDWKPGSKIADYVTSAYIQGRK
jgi:arsenite methyltransferase